MYLLREERKRCVSTWNNKCKSCRHSTHEYSRHLPRVIKTLISRPNQPPIFIHTHDIIIIPINNILHGELITKLIRVWIPTGGVHTEANPDERKPILLTGFISRIMWGCLAGFTILIVKGAHVGCTVILVRVATSRKLRGETSAKEFWGFILWLLLATQLPFLCGRGGYMVFFYSPVIGSWTNNWCIVIASLFDSVGCPLDG